jgi:hypothetical protein
MVRTGTWRVLLAAALLGVVLHTAPAGAAVAQDGTDDSTTTTASSTTTTTVPDTSTSTTEPPTTTTNPPSTTAAPKVTAVPNPSVTGPVPDASGTKGHPLAAAVDDLKASGYEEDELFLQGTANVYGQRGRWGNDGRWSVTPAGTSPYRTRILVRKPTDPSRFDGTVVVSWLNVNGAFETDPEWAQIGPELMREGAAFVAVSAQSLGINGPLGAKRWDPERYGSLDLSSDSLSYDVFSQAAQAVLHPRGIDPLAGLSLQRRLIASGQSQSAQRLVTYIDAFQPTAKLFDGFLLVSRFRGAAPLGRTLLPAEGVLDPDGADPNHPFLPDPLAALVSGPAQALVRTDTDVPVFVVLSETEARQDGPVRRADTNLFRTWEVAGSSAADATLTASTLAQLRRDFPKVPTSQLTSCDDPNAFPMRYALRAATASLAAWVAHGTAPATAPPLVIDKKTGDLARDASGNVLGGLRLPAIDVPTARNSGQSTASGYCGLTGATVPFSPAALSQRYPTDQTFSQAMAGAASAAVSAGHLLAADANDIVAAAQGGATQAVLATTRMAAAAAGQRTSAASSSGASATAGADRSGATSAQAARAATSPSSSHGWLATTGRDLFLPVLIGLLLLVNGRVVLTVLHGRRRGRRT